MLADSMADLSLGSAGELDERPREPPLFDLEGAQNALLEQDAGAGLLVEHAEHGGPEAPGNGLPAAGERPHQLFQIGLRLEEAALSPLVGLAADGDIKLVEGIALSDEGGGVLLQRRDLGLDQVGAGGRTHLVELGGKRLVPVDEGLAVMAEAA